MIARGPLDGVAPMEIFAGWKKRGERNFKRSPRAGPPSLVDCFCQRLHLQSHSAFARMSTTQGVAAATAGIPVEDLEPAAGLSSASSCIKLSLLGSTFRPVYLHQVFHDERIPGWRPTAEAEMEARATAGVCHAFPCIFASWNQQVSRVCSVISFQMC